jgi:dipeptidase D
VIEHFKELSSIPRCSYHGEAMRDYLCKKAEGYGYDVTVDGAGNVLCHRAEAKLTLQSHYDMVCIGRAPELEICEDGGWLRARESTLGADNGIGMAMMLELMAEGEAVDCLFTADEEVGLLGARALDVPLKAIPMLNLDSEEEGTVTIGCAGGVDIQVIKPVTTERKEGHCYRVEIGGLPGGHSGVEIHKNIPNAIQELCKLIDDGVALVEIGGGERRNSIPKNAYAIIMSPIAIEAREHFEYLGQQEVAVIREGDDIVKMLVHFAHGVRAYDETLEIVHSSINLALVTTDETGVHVQLSARAMEEGALRALEAQTLDYFESKGCRVQSEGFYPPWPPERDRFAETVLEASRPFFEDAAFSAIHAGLECGVIKERYPKVEMASIGPNITAPHSTSEAVEIASVERVFASVRAIVASLS